MSTNWQYDQACDFDRLKTYDWIGIRAAPTDIVERSLKRQTELRLADRGYQEAQTDPDFRIVVYFDITRLAAAGAGGGAGPLQGLVPGVDIPATWVGEEIGATSFYASREGSVMFDFVDPRSKQLIWRGMAAGSFSPRMTDEERIDAVTETVAALLANFPPKKR